MAVFGQLVGGGNADDTGSYHSYFHNKTAAALIQYAQAAIIFIVIIGGYWLWICGYAWRGAQKTCFNTCRKTRLNIRFNIRLNISLNTRFSTRFFSPWTYAAACG